MDNEQKIKELEDQLAYLESIQDQQREGNTDAYDATVLQLTGELEQLKGENQ